ncbi:MAG: hypothetical protein ACI4AH_02070 [Muribaculaceae bacterium]
MDSDSIYYIVFVGCIILFTFLNSRKKAKAEKEQREQAMRRQNNGQAPFPPTLPTQQQNEPSELQQFDDWFNRRDDEPVAQSLNDIFDEIRKTLQPIVMPQPIPQNPPMPMPLPHVEETPQQRSIAIEPPEMEGQRATAPSPETEDAYNTAQNVLPDTDHDWRRAIIAHEILKQKF